MWQRGNMVTGLARLGTVSATDATSCFFPLVTARLYLSQKTVIDKSLPEQTPTFPKAVSSSWKPLLATDERGQVMVVTMEACRRYVSGSRDAYRSSVEVSHHTSQCSVE